MSDQFHCGVADSISGFRGQGLCQWPRGHVITWSMHDGPPGLNLVAAAELFLQATAVWEQVCDVQFRQLGMHAPADLVIRTASLGSSILAQAILPCGPPGPLWQEFNRDMQWDASRFFGVAVHETGHSLGWGHAASTDCVMFPSFLGVVTPCSWDVDQAVARYGTPSSPGNGGPGTFGHLLETICQLIKEFVSEQSNCEGCGSARKAGRSD